MGGGDSGLDTADQPGAPIYPHARAVERFELMLAWTGLAIKTLVFVGLFVWAGRSTTGAAALQGVVAAEVFTWFFFRILEWRFRGVQAQVGLIYQVMLMVMFWNRSSFFDIHQDAESIAASAGFFLLVVLIKAVAWGAEHAVTASGVKEPA